MVVGLQWIVVQVCNGMIWKDMVVYRGATERKDVVAGVQRNVMGV